MRKRQFPIIGDGGGITSFIHLEDPAAATVLALGQDGRWRMGFKVAYSALSVADASKRHVGRRAPGVQGSA